MPGVNKSISVSIMEYLRCIFFSCLIFLIFIKYVIHYSVIRRNDDPQIMCHLILILCTDEL